MRAAGSSRGGVWALALLSVTAAAAALEAQALVAPILSTAEDPSANVDSCAAWVAPDPRDSLLFVTEKDGDRIEVWSAVTAERHDAHPFIGGKPDSSLPGQFNRPNGVWVIYHVPLGAGFTDLLLVTDQRNLRVEAFRLPELTFAGEFGGGEIGKGYGLAPWRDGTEWKVFISDNIPPAAHPGKIKLYRLRPEGDGITADLVLAFGSSSGPPPLRNVESIVADPVHRRLHVCGDEGGDRVRVFGLDGAWGGVDYGRAQFEFDQEGINLYDTGGGDGYLVVSDQYRSGPPNEFELFDRRTLAPLGHFESPPGARLVTRNTDGAFLEQRPLPGLPDGALYAVNNDRSTHVFDWTDVAEAMGLDLAPLDRSFPARAPSPLEAPASRVALWHHDGSWWAVGPGAGGVVLSRLEDGTFGERQGVDPSAVGAVARARGDLLAALLLDAPARLGLFDYEASGRRYTPRGEAIALPLGTGPLADLALEEDGSRAWIAAVEAGGLRVAASGADPGDWPAPAPLASLGESLDVAPRLLSLPARVGVAWASPEGVRWREHEAGANREAWAPAEPVAPGPVASLALAAAPGGEVLLALSDASGVTRIARRAAGGGWSVAELAPRLLDPALLVDPERDAVTLLGRATSGGREVVERWEADLAALAFSAGDLFTAWPGVDQRLLLAPESLPAGAPDLVALSIGDDGFGYFGRSKREGTADRSAPISFRHEPPPGAVDLPAGVEVRFALEDDRSGVDPASLRLLAGGVPVAPVVRGVARRLRVSARLPAAASGVVTVRIEAADRARPPHVMTPFEYEFRLAAPGDVRFRRGDANGDGGLDISDPIRVLLFLFSGAAPLSCEDAADADDSGRIDISDAVFLLRHLFSGGPPPPAPTGCGSDPGGDADGIGCVLGAGCP